MASDHVWDMGCGMGGLLWWCVGCVCMRGGGLVSGLLGLSKEEAQHGFIFPEGDALAHGVSRHP